MAKFRGVEDVLCEVMRVGVSYLTACCMIRQDIMVKSEEVRGDSDIFLLL